MSTQTNDHKLDALVENLNQLERRTGWDRTLGLGREVIREMWGGLDEYRNAPEGEARTSVRQIAKHPDLAFSATTIHYALISTILLDHLENAGVPVRERLGPSHIRHLGNLRLEQAVDLSRRAILHHWPTRRIEIEARKARRRAGQRPRVPEYERDLKRVERWARAPVFEELDDLDHLGLDELDGLAARLEWAEHLLGQQISRLRRAVKKRGGKLRKLPKGRRARRKQDSGTSYAEIIREVGRASTSAA